MSIEHELDTDTMKHTIEIRLFEYGYGDAGDEWKCASYTKLICDH